MIFLLKIVLKKKVDEVSEVLKQLDKLLPEPKIASRVEMRKKLRERLAEEEENLTLEQEIEMIRRKLEKLQGQGFRT